MNRRMKESMNKQGWSCKDKLVLNKSIDFFSFLRLHSGGSQALGGIPYSSCILGKCFANLENLYVCVWYVMVRRLPNRYIGGYFRCLCVMHWFVNAFVHQNVKDFVKKYAFTDSFGNHLTITNSFGKLAI